MTTSNKNHDSDWLSAFLPLGCSHGDEWEPLGGSVLLLDRPVVWLVTAREVLRGLGNRELSTWVAQESGGGFLSITESQRRAGIDWLHHPAGLSATMFPIDASFRIKAFAETQCTRVRHLKPLQPTASVGCLYGPDIEPQAHPTPAVLDGIITSVNPTTGTIYTTAPMLPHNLGAPLLLASPYGGAVTLAAILLGNATVSEADPRALPVRLGHAICVDAALELIRGKAATQQRQHITESLKQKDSGQAQPEGNPS